MIRMELSRIVISETSDEQVIVLKESEGDRAFPIMIDLFVAVAIDRKVKGAKTLRPLTHDLLENVIRALDGKLEKVVIHDLRKGTFFARLHITREDGRTAEVDSRPSDAIALATQAGAPIFVDEKVLAQAVPPVEDKPEGEPGEPEAPAPPETPEAGA